MKIMIAAIAVVSLLAGAVGAEPKPEQPREGTLEEVTIWWLNVADDEALKEVKGIADVLSVRIQEARLQSFFKSYADVIKRVKGIGPKRMAAIAEYVESIDPD